jgi:hypothetical protein
MLLVDMEMQLGEGKVFLKSDLTYDSIMTNCN